MYEQTIETQGVETIRMVQRALEVLDALRRHRGMLTVSELAKLCRIPPATTMRILKTLELNDWVTQYSEERYGIGDKVSFVMEKDNLFLALMEVAGPIMAAATDRCGQAMNLTVREGRNCYILQQARTRNLVDYVPPLHSMMPFYACAGGKVLFSELPQLLVDQILENCKWKPLTPHTIRDQDTFRRELQTVRRQGYAFDHQESSENGSCISVPVRDNQGNIIAALSFSGIVNVSDPEMLVSYLPALRETADTISHALYKAWDK